MCTASCPAGAWPSMPIAGCPADRDSSCPCACSRACSDAASSKRWPRPTARGQLQCFGEFALPRRCGGLRHVAGTAAQGASGSSMPSARSQDPRRCWPICRATPIGSPSPTPRLLALDERGVTFRWKDYRAKGRTRHKTMTLSAEEFMRRFLLHVLPSGFHRIRHYGLLANAQRARTTSQPHARCCRHRRPRRRSTPTPATRTDPDQPTFVCRHCGAPMLIIETFARAQLHPRPARLECFTLSARRSPHSTASPALHPSAPAREPLAWRREKPCHCTDQAQNFACIRISTTYASVISAEYADLIVTSRRTASLQIPIAPRRC